MNELLNDDGTPSFQTIGQLRDNFETEFAKKELGAAMTNIVVKATPERNDRSSVFDDDNIKALLSNGIKEVAAAAYENKELNSTSFVGQVKDTIDEFCGMESDYREQKAYAIWNTATNKVEASKEIREIFSLEDLKFSKEIKERFDNAMEFKHGQEGEEIVISIGKEIGAALAKAEEKNIIINETSKVIADQKKELEKELQISTDEAENYGNDSEEGEGEETPTEDSTEFDNDEEDEDTTSEESNESTDSEEGSESKNPRNLILCGVEDTDVIVNSLADNLDERIVDGEVTIGEYKPDQTPEEPKVIDASNPDVTNLDSEDKINEKQTEETGIDPNDGTEKTAITKSEYNTDEGVVKGAEIPSTSAILNEMSAEDFKQYRKELYSNVNIGNVLVPLSPVKFDGLPEFSKESLSSVFARATESFDSLKILMNGRFDLLGDIVEKERDEDLSKKFNDYRALATEALNDAELVRDTMDSLHVSPFGIEDVNSPSNLLIGAKFYHLAKGDLKISHQTPKKHWEGLEDGIDAAFDLLTIKSAIRTAHANKDFDTVKGLAPEVASRESVCYENLISIPDDDEKKTEIQNLLKLDELDFNPADIVSPEFLTSIKIALDTTSVKTTKVDISNEEANKAIHDRAKDRIEFITQHDITEEQDEIINAMIEGRDISDYAPTPFEKFVLKETKDEVKESGDPELGAESAGRILDRACVTAVLHSFVNGCKPMDANKTKEFNEYLFGNEW